MSASGHRRAILLVFILCCTIPLLNCIKAPQPQGAGNFHLGSFINDLREGMDALRYSSFNEYKEQFNQRLARSYEGFLSRQAAATFDARRELERYTTQLERLYAETMQTQRRQQTSLAELTQQSRGLQRPRGLDESLDAFRRAYNESLESLMAPLQPREKTTYGMRLHALIQQRGAGIAGRGVATKATPGLGLQQTWQTLVIDEPFAKQIESMRRDLTRSWDSLLSHTSSVQTQAEQAMATTLDDLQRDLLSLQTRIVSSARDFLTATSSTLLVDPHLAMSYTSRDALRDKARLEERFRELDREGKAWVETQAQLMQTRIRLMQDKIQQSNRVYEELLTKRKASMYYTALNDATLNQVLKLIDLERKGHGWKIVREEDGYVVYRKFLHGPGRTSQYACVMCKGIINAPPKDVFALFEDNTRVPEYNTFYDRGRDLEVVAENTKITWTATPPVFPFKPRDFCTLVHMRKLKDGTYVILNKATSHAGAPPQPGYVRGQIVLAANIIQPVPGNARKSRITMLTQLDPGGFAPPVAINHVCCCDLAQRNHTGVCDVPPTRHVLVTTPKYPP